MPWCPGCSHEYNPRKKKCPDCGIELSRGPGFTAPLSLDNQEWLTVRTLHDTALAESLRSYLETHGIDVNLRNMNGSAKKKKKNGAPEVVAVMVLVPVEKAPRAAKLIINDTSWSDMETAELPDHIALEEDDYEYIHDVYEGEDHSFIEQQMYSECRDDFDDIY